MKPGWVSKHLGELSEVTTGQSAPQGAEKFGSKGHPFVRAGSLVALCGGGSESDLEHIDDETALSHRMRLFPAKTVVFAKSGMSATKGLVYRLKSPCYVVSHLAAVLPSRSLRPDYLEHWLREHPPSRLIANDAYPSIRTSQIKNIAVHHPEYDEEQKRIASILDKAAGIRRKRAKTMRLADDFLKSTFLNMFGDPVTNPKGWPVSKLEGLGEVQGGLQVSGRRAHDGIEVPYLRVANVYRDALDLTEIKTIMVTRNELERTTLQKGDVLVVEGHGNRDEIGRSAVWDESIIPCVHQNHLIRVRALKGTTPEYLSAFLNSAGGRRQMFRAGRTTSGLNTISTSTVRNILMLAPPPKLQAHYSKVVAQVARSKTDMQAHERLCAEQFHALSQNAFQGEL